VGKRSARTTAKQVRKKPAPRKRIARARLWNWVDVAWVAVMLLIAKVFTILTLGHRFTALMPVEGVVGVRVALLIVLYLVILMVLAYRAHCRNLSFVDAYRLRPDSRVSALTDISKSDSKKYFSAWKSVLMVVTFFVVLRTFAIIYTYVTRELGWVTPPSESLTDLFGASVFGLAAAIISIVILAPFIEELVFRVIMFDTFVRSMAIAFAVILQGLIFALYHFSLWAAIPNFLLALACVYLIQKCKTSLPAITLHVLYNAAVVAAAFYLAMV